MQGCENSGESRIHLTMQRIMYPGNCGYSSNTGGIMKNLRESTNNTKVFLNVFSKFLFYTMFLAGARFS